MTIYNQIKDKLEADTNFRERRFRAKGLRELALQVSGLESKYKASYPLSPEDLTDFAMTHESCRRIYTKVQADCENLRGTDYEDKTGLEQDKTLEMGYEMGFEENVRKLNTLN